MTRSWRKIYYQGKLSSSQKIVYNPYISSLSQHKVRRFMSKISKYHRPDDINEALELLSRSQVTTAILAGGTQLVPELASTFDEVVDLQAIGLNEINYTGQGVTLGAMVHLQDIVDNEQIARLLRDLAKREGPNTLRHAATVGGVIASADIESELLAAFLVCDANIEIQTSQETKQIPLSEFLRDVSSQLAGGIITSVTLSTLGDTASDRVARTPADRPIVAAVARKGPENVIQLALCGVANTPILVNAETDIKAAVNPPDDFRGSREYRRQMAATLSRRVLEKLK